MIYSLTPMEYFNCETPINFFICKLFKFIIKKCIPAIKFVAKCMTLKELKSSYKNLVIILTNIFFQFLIFSCFLIFSLITTYLGYHSMTEYQHGLKLIKYVFTKPLHHKYDMTQSQFF